MARTIAEVCAKFSCSTPAIRQGFGALTLGRLNPSAPIDARNPRLGWPTRYGLPWGSRGDHSAGIGVIAELARRDDNPLDLDPHPYLLTFTDQCDAAILGTASGKPAWEVLRERFGEPSVVDEVDGEEEDCPAGWNCGPMPPDLLAEIRAGAVFVTDFRAKPSDRGWWQRMSQRVGGKPWVRYNPLKMADPRIATPEPPVEPPVEPPPPPVEPPTEPPTSGDEWGRVWAALDDLKAALEAAAEVCR